MRKALCIFALSLFILLFVIFMLDIIAGIPFNKSNMKMDIGFIVCSLAFTVISFFDLRKIR